MRASMVTSTPGASSAFVEKSPPKPEPMTTTRWGADDGVGWLVRAADVAGCALMYGVAPGRAATFLYDKETLVTAGRPTTRTSEQWAANSGQRQAGSGKREQQRGDARGLRGTAYRRGSD
ncbi:hypothetical protein GCM10011366_25850 [Ornithinimicrobium tianjinense]|uniref:Uncharacterized protein n=1 Tax=Ornithinimicrobium tianjinense TaxID=1195761 RepID=A0A917BS90_9MICO|nr:hypothetical protein GCM10011366_25850 [Ornithinimicrobium tianjinense]